MPNPQLAFVYGSLMEGMETHYLLAQKGIKKIGQGQVQALLYDLGDFPGAVPSSNPNDKVFGELYRVPEEYMRILDDYEGANSYRRNLYRRERVKVVCEEIPGQSSPPEFKVWVYFFNGFLLGESARVVSGDWRAHKGAMYDV